MNVDTIRKANIEPEESEVHMGRSHRRESNESARSLKSYRSVRESLG